MRRVSYVLRVPSATVIHIYMPQYHLPQFAESQGGRLWHSGDMSRSKTKTKAVCVRACAHVHAHARLSVCCIWVHVFVCACAAASSHCLRAVIDLCPDISLADVVGELPRASSHHKIAHHHHPQTSQISCIHVHTYTLCRCRHAKHYVLKLLYTSAP